MITLREETIHDIEAREALLDTCFGPTRFEKTCERLREGRLPAEGLALVAERDGKVVGTLRLWHVSAGRGRPALMLGPLYHLASEDDRLRALREAARVVRPGGFVFAAGLSRYIAFGKATLGRAVPDPFPGEWVQLAAAGTPSPGRFPAGHFHTAEELESEVSAAGLEVLEVVGVEGPAGALLESLHDAGEKVVEAALTIARAASALPGVRDMSAHLIAVAQVA